MPTKKLNFEDSIRRLEEIVTLLEQGDAGLEQSLALFEEGTGLMRRCADLLDKAEQKVAMLKVDANGQPEQAPFSEEE